MAVTLPSELFGLGTQLPLEPRYWPGGQSSYGGSAIQPGEVTGGTAVVVEATPTAPAIAATINRKRNMLAPTNYLTFDL